MNSKLALQPDEGGDSKASATTEGGDSKYSTTTHDNKMPPDGYVVAKPGAGGAPPDGAHLERLANEHQVNTIEDGDTLAGNEFDGSRHEARDHELKPHLLFLVFFPDQQQQIYLP